MSKTLAIWFFLLFNILKYSAHGNTQTPGTGDFRTSKQQKEPKLMHSMITEPSKPGIQRTFPGLHVAQQSRISGLAKGTYRGPSNLNPRNVRGKSRKSNSYSTKPSSLFMAALRHLFFALLLVPCFF